MKDISNLIIEKPLLTEFYCNLCKEVHKLTISEKYFKGNQYPISYAYVHDDPQKIVILYIDKELKVRGVEYPNGIGINKKQLDLLLNNARSNTLKSIPIESIFSFKLMKGEEILKLYTKKGFENKFIFPMVSKMQVFSKETHDEHETSREFYMKFNDYWIGFMELLEYSFYIAVKSSIDIDHLKFQMMHMFEIFSKNIKY